MSRFALRVGPRLVAVLLTVGTALVAACGASSPAPSLPPPAAEVAIPAPSPPPAPAAPAPPPDAEHAAESLASSPRHGEWVDIAMPDGGKLVTWVVYPEVAHKAAVVVVIHEIFGLTDWVRAVADTLAAQGYIALAPDLLSGLGPGGGGTAALGDQVVPTIRTLTPATVTARLDAVARYGRALPAANGKLGVVGYCWGGAQVWNYAVAQPTLDAGVVYYGTSPAEPAAYASVRAPILGLYGSDDARVNATVPTAEAEMKKAGKSFAARFFEGAGHGFLRQQTGRDGANLRAAEQAWPAMLEHFAAALR